MSTVCRISEKKLALMILTEAADQLPDYTLGDLLYSVLRKLGRKQGISMRFLRDVPDRELHFHIDRAIREEKGQ